MLNMKGFRFKDGVNMSMEELSNTLVGVHWNSHQDTFSIVKLKSKRSVGTVIGYADYVELENCYTFIEKSKQKVVREQGRKERHAFICGYIKSFDYKYFDNGVYYNPKKLDNFVDAVDFLHFGTINYIRTMDKVGMAKNHDVNKPMVTYGKGTYSLETIGA